MGKYVRVPTPFQGLNFTLIILLLGSGSNENGFDDIIVSRLFDLSDYDTFRAVYHPVRSVYSDSNYSKDSKDSLANIKDCDSNKNSPES
ncbi:hypothetical protein F8M41_006271 [Gigaspora margarita]|uniref:Uncharacterized protein n=1 Tax=Gigaspora margarita TaxID=4874 RepID=A0A8H3X7L4_GIGMA|nr:hypothetical protein F8M41_006271 [Gigaspora margarita]